MWLLISYAVTPYRTARKTRNIKMNLIEKIAKSMWEHEGAVIPNPTVTMGIVTCWDNLQKGAKDYWMGKAIKSVDLVIEWIHPQCNDIPMTGEIFANALNYEIKKTGLDSGCDLVDFS